MPAGIVTRRLPTTLRPALAAAGVAGRLDDPALATAARARGDVDHLAEHRLADAADLAAAVALGALDRRAVPALAPDAAAGVAAAEDRELDLLLGAEDRLVERDAQVVAQVRARSSAAPRRAPAAAAPPKNASKMSEKPPKPAEPNPWAPPAAPAPPRPARPNMS